jgi:N-acetylglutamate synthase-like GNAT family acetyltransferase
MAKRMSTLSFREITEADISDLTKVMTRAFDDDARKHLGQERGGPKGYDNGEFFRKWLFGCEETEGYMALCEQRIVGGVIVWIFPNGHNILGTIFVDPAFQDQGIGTNIWHYIQSQYPATKSWRLATPDWATKNHHFYQAKCGFQRVDADSLPEAPTGESVYQKDVSRVM